jgi:hypothetical protein
MHGKVVLVCTDRTRTWRHVTPSLAGAGNQLVHADSTERAVDLLWTGAVDLVLIEWPSGIALDPVVEAAVERAPVVILVGETGVRALDELVCRRGLFHLCAARPEQEASAVRLLDPAELVATSEKILRRDLFGLDKYVTGFGIERPSRTVRHADERDGLVAELVEAVRTLGAGRRIAESVGLVADELITNAVYNAPRGPDGKPRYAHISRREKIALEPSEAVRVEYGSDGRTFGLSVVDRFGALEPRSLRSGIERCLSRHDPIEQKAGGAGIGLYSALCHSDHLIFNLDSGVRTEVIALWGLARRSGGRGIGAASLHIFEQSGPPIAGADVGRSIDLSDSAKREIVGALAGDSGAQVALTASADESGIDTSEMTALPGEDEVTPAEALPRTRLADDLVASDPSGAEAETLVVEVDPDLDLAMEAARRDREIERAVTEPIERAVTDPIERAVTEPIERAVTEPIVRAEARQIDLSSAGEADGSVDLADLFEVATIMDESGLLDSRSPPWVGPLTCLRGVQILRRLDAPDLEAALIRVRQAASLADAIEVLLTHLVADWTAAMLLCRMGDTLIPWTAAGDVDSWEELCEIEVPLAPGWLSARSLSPGVTTASLDEDQCARRLADSLTAEGVDEGLALSFVLDHAVLVVFACRMRLGPRGQDAGYEELQRELSELTARIGRPARQPATRRARAGAW